MAQELSQLVFGRYIILEHLGRGAFGTVWKAKNVQSGMLYAIKWIPESQIDSQQKRIRRQMALLKRLRHPNIVRLFQVIKVRNGKDTLLVFQYVKSDLLKCLQEKNLTQEQKYKVMRQLVEGLAYLHRVGVIHRDIKPSNVLVDDDLNVKICDFGLSKLIQQKMIQQVHTQRLGTRWYRAPQILFGSRLYDFSADVWSLGCLIYQLFMGFPLFQGVNQIEQAKLILQFKGFPTQAEIEEMRVPENSILINNLRFFSIKRKQSLKYWRQSLDESVFNMIAKMLQYSPKKRVKLSYMVELLTVPQQQFSKQPNIIIAEQNLSTKNINNYQDQSTPQKNRDQFRFRQKAKQLQVLNKINYHKKAFTIKIKDENCAGEQIYCSPQKKDKKQGQKIYKSHASSFHHSTSVQIKKISSGHLNGFLSVQNEKNNIKQQSIFQKVKFCKVRSKNILNNSLKRLENKNNIQSYIKLKSTDNMKIIIFDSFQRHLRHLRNQQNRHSIKKVKLKKIK